MDKSAISSQLSDKAGNSDEWHQIWTDLPDDHIQLFTRGEPMNILQFWQRCYFEDIWKLLGEKASDSRYLELGSGRGTTSMYIASQGGDVTLADLSEQALRLAQINFRREGLPQPQIIVADVQNTGLPDKSYDCIYNIGLLEHFNDPKSVLQEAFRLLRPGGWLYMVIVPEVSKHRRLLAEIVFAPWRLIIKSAKTIAKKILKRSHTISRPSDMIRTAYPREKYERIMTELGAENVRCIPYNPYHRVYDNGLGERIQLFIYQLQYRLKRQTIRLETWDFLAFCDLLICRKQAK